MSEMNGNTRQQDKVRVALIGVGNCANSFLQGLTYYRDAAPDAFVPGLMHVDLGGYHISDIEFTAAFDVDADKVGRDLGEAIFRGQNNTVKFSDVPKLNVPVHRGMTHDGIGKYLSKVIKKAPGETADVVRILQETGTDVVVSYLPVGSEEATKWYVEQVLSAGCAFVNCVPVFIAREPYWRRRFEERGVPIVGDDIKSQVGATIVHRQLTRLFRERGVKLERTHQLNVGGNTDFMNMSAGSLCWFEAGITDSYGPLRGLRDGLGLLAGSNCPHYDGEARRRPTYHREITAGLPAGIAADDFCGLHFAGTELVEAASSRSGAGAYRVELADGAVRETPIPARYLGA